MVKWITRAAALSAAVAWITGAAWADTGAPSGWTVHKKGAALVLTPPDIPAGQEFDAVVSQVVPLGGRSLDTWLNALMASDERRLGTMVKDAGISRQANGALTCVRGFQGKSGRAFLMVYVALPEAGGARLVRIASTSSAPAFKADIETAVRFAMTLPASGSTSADKASNDNDDDDAPDATGGIKPSEIAAVLTESYDGTGFGGMSETEYTPVVLLKDGWYCDNIETALGRIDEAVDRRKRPGDWGRWRRSAGKYQTYNGKSGQWEDASWDNRMTPAATGDRLSGHYESSDGGGDTAVGGNMSFAVGGDITFSPDGTCRMETAFSGTSGAASVGSRRANIARYRLDGYTIEFQWPGGKTERRAFFWMDAGSKDGFYLNNVAYVKRR